jgi:23S rRNA (adenine2503-C2)-methyltransferase
MASLDIRALSLADLQIEIQKLGEKPFRAKQIYQWIWQKSAVSFAQMTDLSLGLRELLEQKFCFQPLVLDKAQSSEDGTVKYAFRLHDKHVVEGVLIPTKNRMTACISCQVGCSLTCKFCATGKLGRARNLTAAEIYDQVAYIRQDAMARYNIPLSNIVYMGMGEPLLNYKPVLESINHITQDLVMSASRITVSTAGIAKMIRQLADDGVRFNLALSLHAATDDKREKIMPINEHNNLKALLEALQYFYHYTRNEITLEYIIFKDFNDSLGDAEALWKFAKQVPCKINIIEYNSIGDGAFAQAEIEKVDAFQRHLEDKGLVVNVRRSRGKDIDAACGQLANKLKDR